MTWEQFQEHVREHYANWPTPEILLFEVAVVVAFVATYRFLRTRVEAVGRHALLMAVGVFLLEFFTGPMWENRNLGVWAYVYSDVSWIFTLAWTTVLLLTVYAVDSVVGPQRAWQRFAGSLVIMTPVALVLDATAKALGIRVYSPEVLEAAGPARIPVLDVPAAGLYYIPVFMSLVLSFYRSWLPLIEPGEPSGVRLPLVRRLVLTAVAVLLFEIVVEPMATNNNFPAWSYIYRDITILMTGFWVVLVTACTFAIDRLLPAVDYRLRFAASLGLIAAIATPIEGWFIQAGYRVYGPSATADFVGIRTLIGDLPLEVVAAIPIYCSLVIAFVRYWDGSVDRRLGFRPRRQAADVPAVGSVPLPAR